VVMASNGFPVRFSVSAVDFAVSTFMRRVFYMARVLKVVKLDENMLRGGEPLTY